jgi:capsular polysaccharide biosynthesis protein
MELRLYGRIILKRAWIILALVGVVLVVSLVWQPQRPTVYQAHMRFVVGVKPEPQGDYYAYDRYYTWLTAEYLVDDLAEVVKSRTFAAQVAALSGLPAAPGAIHGATFAGKTHRVLGVTITWGNEAELGALANATVELLTQRAGIFFAQLGADAAVVSLIDPPQIGGVGRSLRERLDLPLRLLLAVAAGIGLAFLLDYIDLTVRHRSDLAALGLPILAEIPMRRRWRWLLPIGRRAP